MAVCQCPVNVQRAWFVCVNHAPAFSTVARGPPVSRDFDTTWGSPREKDRIYVTSDTTVLLMLADRGHFTSNKFSAVARAASRLGQPATSVHCAAALSRHGADPRQAVLVEDALVTRSAAGFGLASSDGGAARGPGRLRRTHNKWRGKPRGSGAWCKGRARGVVASVHMKWSCTDRRVVWLRNGVRCRAGTGHRMSTRDFCKRSRDTDPGRPVRSGR